MNYQNFNEEVFRTNLSELDWSFVSENKDRNISFETVCYYHVTYEFQSESTPCSLPECQGTPYLKQVPYLKLKWQQCDLNSQPLSLQPNTQPFSQTGKMTGLCCEYLSVWCIWLFFIALYEFQSESTLKFAWMSRNSLLEAGTISEV